MSRTKKQIAKENESRCGASHSSWCHYPSEPCCCEVDNASERRTTHKNYCDYPSEPCCCGLE